MIVRTMRERGVIDRHRDELRDDRIEILDPAVGDRIEACGARRAPFLGPQRRNGIVMREIRKAAADLVGRDLNVPERADERRAIRHVGAFVLGAEPRCGDGPGLPLQTDLLRSPT
ncbi:hypothetical protein [Methylobacterium sp. sgz302541]|uniref:hypothetical protein n=1 Tax=unclassified Methylobacterium TaxID=2615210 RepID=UPI003D34DDED